MLGDQAELSAGGEVTIEAESRPTVTIDVTTGDYSAIVGVGSARVEVGLDLSTQATIGESARMDAGGAVQISALTVVDGLSAVAIGTVGSLLAYGEVEVNGQADLETLATIGVDARVVAGGDATVLARSEVTDLEVQASGGGGGLAGAGGAWAEFAFSTLNTDVTVGGFSELIAEGDVQLTATSILDQTALVSQDLGAVAAGASVKAEVAAVMLTTVTVGQGAQVSGRTVTTTADAAQIRGHAWADCDVKGLQAKSESWTQVWYVVTSTVWIGVNATVAGREAVNLTAQGANLDAQTISDIDCGGLAAKVKIKAYNHVDLNTIADVAGGAKLQTAALAVSSDPYSGTQVYNQSAGTVHTTSLRDIEYDTPYDCVRDSRVEFDGRAVYLPALGLSLHVDAAGNIVEATGLVAHRNEVAREIAVEDFLYSGVGQPTATLVAVGGTIVGTGEFVRGFAESCQMINESDYALRTGAILDGLGAGPVDWFVNTSATDTGGFTYTSSEVTPGMMHLDVDSVGDVQLGDTIWLPHGTVEIRTAGDLLDVAPEGMIVTAQSTTLAADGNIGSQTAPISVTAEDESFVLLRATAGTNAWLAGRATFADPAAAGMMLYMGDLTAGGDLNLTYVGASRKTEAGEWEAIPATLQLSEAASAGGDFNLTHQSAGSLTVNRPITADDVELEVWSGSVYLQEPITATHTVRIQAGREVVGGPDQQITAHDIILHSDTALGGGGDAALKVNLTGGVLDAQAGVDAQIVSSGGTFTVARLFVSAGGATLTVPDTAGSDDLIVLAPNASLYAERNLTLSAGDGLSLGSGAVMRSPISVTLALDNEPTDPDPGSGLTLDFSGGFFSDTPVIKIRTGADDDTIRVTDLPEAATVLDIHTGAGDDRLLLGDADHVVRWLSGTILFDGGAGSDAITVDNSGAAVAGTGTLWLDNETSLPYRDATTPLIRMSGMGDLWYLGVEDLDLALGLPSVESVIDVDGTGADVATVRITGTPAQDRFRVGNGSGLPLSGVHGLIRIDGGAAGEDRLEIIENQALAGVSFSDDRLTATTFTGQGISGGITWDRISSLSISLLGNTDLTIAAAPVAETSVAVGSGSVEHFVRVGEGNFSDAAGQAAFPAGRSLTVSTTGTNYTLEIDDHLNATAYTALLNGDGLSINGFWPLSSGFTKERLLAGSGGGTVAVLGAPANLKRATIVGGAGADLVVVSALPSGTVLDVQARAGDDELRIAGAAALQGTVGPVFFQGGTGTDRLWLSALDAAATLPALYVDQPAATLWPYIGTAFPAVRGLGLTNGVYYDAETLDLTLTNLADNVFLNQTAAGTQSLTIYGMGGDDAFYLGGGNALADLHGQITLSGGDNDAGTNGDRMVVQNAPATADFDSSTGYDNVLDMGTFSGQGLDQPLAFSGFEDLGVFLGSGRDSLAVGLIGGDVGSLQISLGGGDDRLSIDTSVLFSGVLTMAGGTGADQVVLDDRSGGLDRNIVIQGAVLQGLPAAGGQIGLGSDFESARLLLSNQTNRVEFDGMSLPLDVVSGQGGTTYVVTSLAAGKTLALQGGSGRDVLQVGQTAGKTVNGTVTFQGGDEHDGAYIYALAAGGSVCFDGGAGNDFLTNVSDSATTGSLQAIDGAVTFFGGVGTDTLDLKHTTAAGTVNFDAMIPPGGSEEAAHIGGLGMSAGIWYDADQVGLQLGSTDGQANQVYIDATAPGLTDLLVVGGAGEDDFHVGESLSHTLAAIHGTLDLRGSNSPLASGEGYEDRLFIDNVGDTASHTDTTITAHAFSGMGLPGSISLYNIAWVTVTPGSGGDRIMLESVPFMVYPDGYGRAYSYLTINDLNADDIVYMTPEVAAGLYDYVNWRLNDSATTGAFDGLGVECDPGNVTIDADHNLSALIGLYDYASTSIDAVWASSGWVEYVDTSPDGRVSMYRWHSATNQSQDITVFARSSAGLVTASTLHVTASPFVHVQNQSGVEGDVTLTGSITHPGLATGETYTVQWRVWDASSGSFVTSVGGTVTRTGDALVGTVTGTAALKVGTYSVALSVSDSNGTVLSGVATVTIANQSPVVDLGPAQQVVGFSTSLVGVISDPGLLLGETMSSYAWVVTSEATGETVATGSSETLALTVPSYGAYAAKLTVIDAHGGTGSDAVRVFFAASGSEFPPIVDAGPDVTLDIHEDTVQLTGTYPDGDLSDPNITASWAIYFVVGANKYPVQSGSGWTITPSFKAGAGTYLAVFSVSDYGHVGSDSLTITATETPYVVTTNPVVTYEGANVGGATGPYLARFTTRVPITDAAGSQFAATIDWGDGSPLADGLLTRSNRIWKYNAGGVDYYEFSFLVQGAALRSYASNSYSEPGGVYPICITVTHPLHAPQVIHNTAEVNTHAPVIINAGLTPSAPVLGQTTTLAVQFGDGPDWTYDRALHVFWGDGVEEYVYLANDLRTATLSHTYAAAGDYLVRTTVERRDEAGHVGASSPTASHLVTVTAEPQIGIANLPATSPEGTAISLGVTGNSFTGGDTFAWTVLRGADVFATGTGSSFTFVPPDDDVYMVTLDVSSTDGNTRRATGSVDVTDVPPTLTLSGAATVAEGATYTLNLNASDPGTDTIDSWSIDWSDGTDLQVVSGNPASITHVFADGPASYTISARGVNEDDSFAAGNTVDVAVANIGPTVVINGLPATSSEGSTLNLTATVTDPGNELFTYAWTVTKGGTPYASGTNAAFAFTPDDGPAAYQVTLAVSDGTDTATSTGSVNVTNLPPLVTFSGTASVREDATYALDVTVTNRGADTISAMSIDWGDGTAGESLSEGVNQLTHTYADPGSYTITVQATDEDGSYSSTKMLTVIPVPDVLIAGLPASSPEGTPLTLSANVTDPGSGIASYHWSVTRNGTAYGTVGTGTGYSLTPDDDGTYLVTLAVTDTNGSTGTATETLTVMDVAPTLTLTGAASLNEGSVYTLGFSATDPGADTISLWTIDWGDGTAVSTAVAGASSANHTFTNDGSYTITIGVTNEDGTFTATREVVVANVAPVVTITDLPWNIFEGDVIPLSSTVTDPGTEQFTYAWTVTKNGAVSGILGTDPSFTFIPDDNGTYSVTLTVSDGTDTRQATTVTRTVYDRAPNPLISGAGTVTQGQVYTLHLSARDPGDDTNEWEIFWNDGTSNTFVTGSEVDVEHVFTEGYQNRYLKAWVQNEDTGGGGYWSNDLHVYVRSTIEGDVTFSGLPASIDEGTPVMVTATVTNTTATDLQYSWQAYNTTTGGFEGSGDAQTFTFIPLVAGELLVNVAVYDDAWNLVGSSQQTFTVNDVPPQITLYGEDAVLAGQPYSLYLGADCSIADNLGYWEIDWGDGNPVERVYAPASFAGHTYDKNLATYTVSAAALFAAPLNPGGEPGALVPHPAENTLAVTVIGTKPAVAIAGLPALSPEGTAIELSPALATTPGATAEYAWTVQKNGVPYAADTKQDFQFTPTDDGDYEVTLVVMDGGIEIGRAVESMTVYNVDPVFSIRGPVLHMQGTPYTLDLSAIDPGDDPVSSWTIHWGDGVLETVPGGATSVTHDYPVDGWKVISAFVTSEDGFFRVSRDIGTNIMPPVDMWGETVPVTITGALEYSPEGTPLPLTAEVLYDPAPLGENPVYKYQWTVLKDVDPEPFSAGTDRIADFTPDDDTRYDIRVDVSREDDSWLGSAMVFLETTDVAPTLALVGEPTVLPGDSSMLSLSATDPGDDSIEQLAINWGDGTYDLYVDLATELPTHTYAATPARYLITATAVEFVAAMASGKWYPVAGLSVAVNAPATITGDGTAALTETDAAQSVSGTLTVSDPDSGESLFAAQTDVAGSHGFGTFSIDAAGAWTYAMNSAHDEFVANQVYTDSVTVFSVDGTASQAISVTITGTNDAPTVSGVDAISLLEGQTATATGRFSDPETDPVTLLASVGVVTAHADGTWTWTFATTDGPDSRMVTVTATDANLAVSTMTFTLTVENVAPTATIGNSSPVNEGSPVTVSLTDVFDACSADTAADLHYSFATSVAELATTYAEAVDGANRSFTFEDNGTPTVYARIFDKDGGFTDYQTVVTVNNVAPTAVIVNSGPANEGSPVTVSLSEPRDFSSVDMAAGLHYSFATSIAGLATSYAAAVDSPSRSFTLDDNDAVTIYARIFDKDGGFAHHQTVVTVTNVAPTATIGNSGPVNEGSPVTVSLTNAFDPSSVDTAAGFHYSFATSVNELPVSYAAATDGASREFIFDDDGATTVYARIFDRDGGWNDYETVLNVNNAAPVVEAGGDQVVAEGVTVSLAPATFTDAGTGDTHTATIDWGDGSPVEAGLVTETPFGPPGSVAGMNGTISGSHVYADKGTYTVTVRVRDDEMAATDPDSWVESFFDVFVENVLPVANADGPYTILEGQGLSLDARGSHHPAPGHTITRYEWDFDLDGTYDLDTVESLATASAELLRERGLGDGPWAGTIRLRVTDSDGETATAETTVTVNNVPPQITGLDARPAQVILSRPFELDIDFTDPGAFDVHSVTIDWDDGGLPEQLAVPAGTRTMTVEHQYGVAGSCEVLVTVRDDDLGEDSQRLEIGVTEQDIRMLEVTADGETDLLVTYEIVGSALPAFGVGFYLSADPFLGLGDTLIGSASIDQPADLSAGSHTKVYVLGAGPGEIALPGAGREETDDEYYVLVVADSEDLVEETDADPIQEDNTASLVGAYHTPGGDVFVHGTQDADQIAVSSGSLQIVVNGVPLTYDLAVTTGLRVRGHGGDDQASFDAGGGFAADPPLPVYVHGGTGSNRLNLSDSTGDDALKLYPTRAEMSGPGYVLNAEAAGHIEASAAGGGNDDVRLYDSAADDRLVSRAAYVYLEGAGFYNYVQGFGEVSAYATAGGLDKAQVFDSAGNDKFVTRPTYAYIEGPSYFAYMVGFDEVSAYATVGGTDTAILFDTVGDDRFISRREYSYMQGPGYLGYAAGFEMVSPYATAGGVDKAVLFDSPGDDLFVGRPGNAYLQGPGFLSYVTGFDEVTAYASAGGTDKARFFDAAGDDVFVHRPTTAYISGTGFYNYVQSFDEVTAYATAGGVDTAKLFDSAGNDKFVGRPDYSYLEGPGYLGYASGFETVSPYATAGGLDTAMLFDSAGDDKFVGRPAYSYLEGPGYLSYVAGFAEVKAYSTAGGVDISMLFDSAGDDLFVSRPESAYLSGTGFFVSGQGFHSVSAYARLGGTDTARLFDSAGDDNLYGRGNAFTFQMPGVSSFGEGFDLVEAYAQNGGANTLDVLDVDYLFEHYGDWL